VASKKVKFWHPTGFIRVEVGSEPVVVGRAGDIKLSGDERLSRRHGKVWYDGRAVWYEDLGSVNGSFVHGSRLSAAIRITHGTAVYLGETRLSLDESDLPPLCPPAVPGMELKSHGRSDSEGLREALAGQGTASAYVAAMYDIVERLLHADRKEFISSALRQLRHAVPGAQHLALVNWPPEPDGRFIDLGTGHPMKVSASLARYAVEQKRALLLSGHDIPPDMEAGPSMLHMSSAVYVPLVTQNEDIIGLLCADSHSDTRPLTEADFQFICAVGGLFTNALVAEQLRHLAQERHVEMERAKARKEALVNFLQIASHDLNNLMTAVTNGATLVMTLQQEEPRQRMARVILSAGRRAIDLIRAYLDVAQLEGEGGLRVMWSEVNPQRLLDEEKAVIETAMGDRLAGISIVNELDEGPWQADDRKMRQILGNLLSNAIKYSPQGGQVRIWCEPAGDGVRVHVRDHGVGIAPHDQEKVFAAFERVGDLSLAPGTGLGLWLTAALVAAHGGKIWLESVPGQGSTFSFTLPAKPPE
jgi:signal transduction histidine kinase